MSEEIKKGGIFHDTQGNISSKRIIGTALISSGGVFLLAVGIISVLQVVKDPNTALQVGKTLIIAGAGLLGVGVFEGLKGVSK